MRKSGVAAAIAIAVVGMAFAAAAPASASRGQTHVVCVTDDWQHWTTSAEPHSCALHRRKGCWCHADLVLFRDVHWVAWGKRRAYGKGEETFTGGVTVQERVRLFRPRWGRTPWTGSMKFFSRAKVSNRFGTFTINLDVPHGRYLP